ncbi:hypothetical protein QBC39DRAFT_100834 [Podospora conica]|nr:hypothetical protein QBC39DRAFT_100834 [Schizothecium conicum]
MASNGSTTSSTGSNHGTSTTLPDASLNFRRILPAFGAAAPAPRGLLSDGGRPSLPGSSIRSTVPPKNVHVKAACDTCRKRKVKCSGERPRCTFCERSGVACHYMSAPAETHSQALKRKLDQMQEENSVYAELFSLFRTLPEKEAVDVVRRLRTETDISTVVRQVKDGRLLLQLHLAPEVRLRYVFPYDPELPRQLQFPDNPYLQSPVYESALITGESQPSSEELERRYHTAYLRPYHAAQIVDPRFSKLRASQWTAVISDDNLFRKLMHAYFLHEYTTYPNFHKDLFLDDLASGGTRFCSSLMVNTILASACHCYRGIPDRDKFWQPQSLGYKFLAEARRLWELECRSDPPSLTVAQSAMLLNIEYNHNSMDKIGHTFLKKAVTMAESLGIFKIKARDEIKSRKMRAARDAFAWGLYSWAVMQSYYFFREPLIREPPEMPLPDPNNGSSWYGEFYLEYPLCSTYFPAFHAHTVQGIASLRTILGDIASKAFRNGKKVHCLTWDEAMQYKAQLDKWFEDLPDPLTPKRIVFPWHLKIHMEYYSVLYNLFNSFLDPATCPRAALPFDSAAGPATTTSASAVVSWAIMRMETLIRLYYLRHSFAFSDCFLICHLSLLTRATLEAISNAYRSLRPDPAALRTLRSTLFLCIKGANDQSQHIYMSVVIYKLLCDSMEPQDLETLKASVALIEPAEDDMFLASQCRSNWSLPIVKVGSPDDTALDRMVQQMADASISPDGSSRSASSSRRPSPEEDEEKKKEANGHVVKWVA